MIPTSIKRSSTTSMNEGDKVKEIGEKRIACLYCGENAMCITYGGNYRYRIFCNSCKKSFDFYAPSLHEAQKIYRYLARIYPAT